MSDREKLSDKLEELSQFDPESVARKEQLGDLHLESLVPTFESMRSLVEQLRAVNLDRLPNEQIVATLSTLGQFDEAIKKVSEFTITGTGGAPESRRQSLISQIDGIHNTLFNKLATKIAYGLSTSNELSDLHGNLEQEQKEIARLKSDLGDLLQAGREERGKVTVAQHATHFKQEANSHKWTARVWLVALCVLAMVTIWYAFNLSHVQYTETERPPTWAEVAGRILPRIIMISVLSSLTVFAGKSYNASRHNYIVNQHRMRSLSTFDAFVDAADAQTKQAVLLQTANAIFSHQPSGFSSSDADMGQISTVELIRNVKDIKGP